MHLTVDQLQLAGIALLVLMGAGLLLWFVRAAIGWRDGSPVYILPDTTEEDTQDDEDGDGDGTPTHN